MQLDTMTMARRLGMSTYKNELGDLTSEELLESKIYVEEPQSVDWRRHVEQHGPRPEAYALYNLVSCEFEERKRCSK